MTVAATSKVDEMSPPQVLQGLVENPSAVLVDVRTRAEWSFVGLPDLSGIGKQVWTVEWLDFPAMQPNASFGSSLLEMAGGTFPERLFFICRSGARSMAAAQHIAAAADNLGQSVHCTNVSEGFEGDLDAERHRGVENGWKARGLPWVQN